jgi:hypothetical protein
MDHLNRVARTLATVWWPTLACAAISHCSLTAETASQTRYAGTA